MGKWSDIAIDQDDWNACMMKLLDDPIARTHVIRGVFEGHEKDTCNAFLDKLLTKIFNILCCQLRVGAETGSPIPPQSVVVHARQVRELAANYVEDFWLPDARQNETKLLESGFCDARC